MVTRWTSPLINRLEKVEVQYLRDDSVRDTLLIAGVYPQRKEIFTIYLLSMGEDHD